MYRPTKNFLSLLFTFLDLHTLAGGTPTSNKATEPKRKNEEPDDDATLYASVSCDHGGARPKIAPKPRGVRKPMPAPKPKPAPKLKPAPKPKPGPKPKQARKPQPAPKPEPEPEKIAEYDSGKFRVSPHVNQVCKTKAMPVTENTCLLLGSSWSHYQYVLALPIKS